jgi:ABC-type branched-subunit amino acid transport system substrate-binding protein
LDDYSPRSANNKPALTLDIVNTGPWDESVTAEAKKIAGDPDVVAVVVHGEAGVAPAALEIFRQAHVPLVAASSWAQPRPEEAYAVWLAPGGVELAETAAVYTRREQKRAAQVAVVDNGAPTSTAEAKAFAARYRALGGKVAAESTWTGDEDGLAATLATLQAQRPERVFFTGAAEEAGRLVLAMKADKKLKDADLIGMPSIFEPAFFSTTRLKGLRTRAIFPCPDFANSHYLALYLGFAYPRTSHEWKAYAHFMYHHPGRWTAMLYDGVALVARAASSSVAPSGAPSPASGSAAVSSADSGPEAGGGASPASLTRSPEAEGSVTGSAQPAPTAVSTSLPPADAAPSAAAAPTREGVAKALAAVDAYRGIRGSVKFRSDRQPQDPKAMVYLAQSHVNRKDTFWVPKAYGPPF